MPLSTDQFLQKLTEIVEANLGNEQFGVSELAREMGMNRTVLYRKVKLFTNKTISKFISEIRLKRALELLRNDSGNVSEVAYEVGFGSPTYFIKCFNKQYGFPPGEVLKGMHQHTTDYADFQKPPSKKYTAYSKYIYAFIGIILAIGGYYLINQFILEKTTVEKSIVVLPFDDFSEEVGNTSIIETFRDELIGKLDGINDLTIISRTTADTYRNTNKSIGEIAKELHANYFLEGSVTKINDEVKIQLQLISAKDEHLWSEPYVREITNENTFEVQSEVVSQVVNSLKAVISSSEKIEIARKPTENLGAYNFYLQGLDYLRLYEKDRKRIHYRNAKNVFEKALEIDSTFADAYLQMAHIYINNLAWTYSYNQWEKYFDYLDSGFVMIEKAKKFETSDMSKALRLEADYYQRVGMDDKALATFEKSWKSKNFEYYLAKSDFQYFNLEYHESIKYFLLYYECRPNTLLLNATSLSNFIENLCHSGFPETAIKFAKEMLKITNDSLHYKNTLSFIYYLTGNYQAAKKVMLELYNCDTTNLYRISQMIDVNVYLNDIEDALFYFNKLHGADIEISQNFRFDIVHGYLYQITGHEKKAKEMFNNEIEMLKEQIRLNTYFAQELFAHARLAAVYSVMGEKELALKNLQISAQRKSIPLFFINQTSPWFDNIRNEPEFQDCIKEFEKKYNKEHGKIEKLLVREGIIQ
ncbi:helix-turn-helix domain-containing protein [Maribellus sediminis]|uniref:helix-turn-helix domain-containing protein n=1 Tax=Maribellus sediminis TaxID=2696285 RepID=UPI001431474F|nr:helix-turn-helix domain-containing protein [Maribellus sediminis]